MKTSNPFSFAALKMRSMFSTVLFSLTLSPTAAHARPFSLKTSFCGSMNTTAVSFLFMFIVLLQTISQSPPRLFRTHPLFRGSRHSERLHRRRWSDQREWHFAGQALRQAWPDHRRTCPSLSVPGLPRSAAALRLQEGQ